MRKIVRDRILNKCNYRCAYCGSKNNLEIDHIIPLSRGGRGDEDNMQALCRKCNRKKHNSIDFRPYFRIGESPDYIEINRSFPIGAIPPLELNKIIEHLFVENDEIFESGE